MKKLSIYALIVLCAISVCVSDKSVLAKTLLCIDFAFVGFLWDCLLDRPARKRNSQGEKKAA